MKSKQTKREEAIVRAQIYATVSPQEQIKELDNRLGIDIGAKKERAKLMKAAA